MEPSRAGVVDRAMRPAFLLLGLSSLALTACGAPPLGPDDAPAAQGLSSAWRGTFQGTCRPGDVVVFLDYGDGESLSGTMYYETRDAFHHRVTYGVSATLEDGKLQLVQTEMHDADPLPESRKWCTGRYEFSLDEDQSEMEASYEPSNCGCSGVATLESLD
jgi:hypothetical protein